MIIYIDSEFRCHTTNPEGNLREVETDFFDGKCSVFIEGYKFFPSEKKVTRPDGAVFDDGMKTPWKPYDELETAQREYEKQLIADMENALAILLGGETV